MDHIPIEATVRRIGGPDLFGPLEGPRAPMERMWGPRWGLVAQGYNCMDLPSLSRGSLDTLRLDLEVTGIDGEWIVGTATLVTFSGSTMGRRPFLMYALPFDIPSYVTISTQEFGVFQIGLRNSAPRPDASQVPAAVTA